MRFDINKLMAAIDKWSMHMGAEDIHIEIPDNDAKKRDHLGLSMLGADCQRAVFYSWRQVAKPSFPARMLRLFQRGHREEFFFVHMLKAVGITIYEVDPKTGKQFKVSDFEGHLGGSMDGIARDKKKLYVDQDKPFKLEFKTYNEKRFKKLQKEGVRSSDPKYYVQMQGYLKYEPRLKGVLFCAVCKNDDELHFEFLQRDTGTMAMVHDRAEMVINATTPPPGISKRASHWKCKMCDFKQNCFHGKASVKGCRSCVHASPAPDKKWECGLKGHEYGELCDEWEDINR